MDIAYNTTVDIYVQFGKWWGKIVILKKNPKKERKTDRRKEFSFPSDVTLVCKLCLLDADLERKTS